MLLEQHIEELRAEMSHCHPDERRQIAAELELALAELAVIMAAGRFNRRRAALLRAAFSRDAATTVRLR